MIVIRPNPEVIGAQLRADIAALIAARDPHPGLVDCPSCEGDGAIPRPWPDPDPDPTPCPTCGASGLVEPQVRDEWLDWMQSGGVA